MKIFILIFKLIIVKIRGNILLVIILFMYLISCLLLKGIREMYWCIIVFVI